MKRKILSLFLASVFVFATGCGSKSSVEDLRVENMLTKQKAIETYTNGDNNIFKLNTEANNIEIAEMDTDSEAYKKVVDITQQVINELNNNVYNEDSKYLTKEMFDYVKANIDMYEIIDANIIDAGRSSEFYVSDIMLTGKLRDKSYFKPAVNSIAIDGIFREESGKVIIDNEYMEVLVEQLNEYYIEEGINKVAIADEKRGLITIIESDNRDTVNTVIKGEYEFIGEGNDTDVEDNSISEEDNTEEFVDTSNIVNNEQDNENDSEQGKNSSEDEDNNEAEEDNEESDVDTDENVEETETDEEDIILEYSNEGTRELETDLNEIKNILGFSRVAKAKFPGIEYIVDTNNIGITSIGGYGISGNGRNGLVENGYNCENAIIDIRVIIENKTNDINDMKIHNIYIKDIKEDSTIDNTSKSNIPNDVEMMIEDCVERIDCCRRDKNFAALMRSGLIKDKGYAVWNAYISSCSYIDAYDSQIKELLYRDVDNNDYILSVTNYVREGAKGCGSTGRYIDSYLYKISIDNGEAVITDIKRVGRSTVSEPTLDSTGYAFKKLLGYESYRAIDEDVKNSIKETMNKLYAAGTYRVLRGPKTLDINGEQVTIEKGMYDMFNEDTSIMSEAELEAVNSYLRNILVGKGVNVGCTYSGNISEWVGGGDNQIEFISEEIFDYDGLREMVYEKVYYNLSRYGEKGEWVIDERKVITSEKYKDEQYDIKKTSTE